MSDLAHNYVLYTLEMHFASKLEVAQLLQN